MIMDKNIHQHNHSPFLIAALVSSATSVVGVSLADYHPAVDDHAVAVITAENRANMVKWHNLQQSCALRHYCSLPTILTTLSHGVKATIFSPLLATLPATPQSWRAATRLCWPDLQLLHDQPDGQSTNIQPYQRWVERMSFTPNTLCHGPRASASTLCLCPAAVRHMLCNWRAVKRHMVVAT